MTVEGDSADAGQFLDTVAETGTRFGRHERSEDEQRMEWRLTVAFIGAEDPVGQNVAIAATAHSDQHIRFRHLAQDRRV